MTDNLHQLAGQMVALFRQAVPIANAEVDSIIQSGEQGTQRTEHGHHMTVVAEQWRSHGADAGQVQILDRRAASPANFAAQLIQGMGRMQQTTALGTCGRKLLGQ